MTADETVTCMGCPAEAEYGCHGIRDGQVYSEYWCPDCRHKTDRSTAPPEVREGGNE